MPGSHYHSLLQAPWGHTLQEKHALQRSGATCGTMLCTSHVSSTWTSSLAADLPAAGSHTDKSAQSVCHFTKATGEW